jgi:hypothetical protein
MIMILTDLKEFHSKGLMASVADPEDFLPDPDQTFENVRFPAYK